MSSRSRRLLVGSLGGMLLLIMLTGAGALFVFDRIRAGEAALRTRFVERSEWLERVRNGVYASGTLARDYFYEPHGPAAPELLSKLDRLESDVQNASLLYAQSVGSDDATAIGLRGETIAYWKVLDLMKEMAGKRHSASVDDYFRRQLGQRRETMLSIAGDIGAALEREWERGETELDALYWKFRLMLMSGLALVAGCGLVLAVGSGRRLFRLEAETRALSAQLVDAQEQERRSIARELHDEIGQALSRVLLDVGQAAAIAEPEELRSRLASVSASAERIVEEVRRIALSLRPSMLDDLGLVAALEWQAREVGTRTGLSVQVLAEESAGELPEAHRICIYRVVQEALQNSARHAAAHRVQVRLTKSPAAVSLRVEDDGRGFSPARRRGIGLLGMEERVAQLHGRLRIDSEAGCGTTVSAEIPL